MICPYLHFVIYIPLCFLKRGKLPKSATNYSIFSLNPSKKKRAFKKKLKNYKKKDVENFFELF